MPAKVATKKTDAVESKPTARAPALTEEEKRVNPDYILNPHSKKMVLRTSPTGKKIIEAEKAGVELAKPMTETARLMLFIQTLQDKLCLTDSDIKQALDDESVKAEMPRAFPVAWGGKKSDRHPDHPKQPRNSFIQYSVALNKQVAEANPDLEPKEVQSLLGQMWNQLTNEQKEEYEEMARIDKQRYQNEMEVFEKNHPELARAKSSPGSDKPTKKTAYHMYQEQNKEIFASQNTDLTPKEVLAKLAAAWKEVKKDADELAKYQALADKANEGFKERVSEYIKSPGTLKLSPAEQAKADDPEHYELNTETGRHVLKSGWKKNPDGSFTFKDAKSPKTTKAAPKPRAAAKAAKPAKVEEPDNDSDNELLED